MKNANIKSNETEVEMIVSVARQLQAAGKAGNSALAPSLSHIMEPNGAKWNLHSTEENSVPGWTEVIERGKHSRWVGLE